MLPSRYAGRTPSTDRAGHYVAVVFVVLTVIGLAILPAVYTAAVRLFVVGEVAFEPSPRLLLVAVLDAAAAAVVIVPPMLAGLWLGPMFQLGRLPLRWHFLIGASLGLGVTSLLVLVLGLTGILHREFWVGLLGLFAVLGTIRLRVLLKKAGKDEIYGDSREAQRRAQVSTWLWLVLVPFCILALHAAANAPGFLWAEEGHGYDVLEYHLQMPKEYLSVGRIAYAPHNVYASFPMNVEMLYLLAMIVHDEVFDLGTTANMIHLIFGVLTVYAAWVVGRQWSPRIGQVSAIALGTVGWLGYLSGLAYVELGMLFFSATALAALMQAIVRPVHGLPRGWIALCGVCGGFACGCKYTAIGLTVLPMAAAMVLCLGGTWRRRGMDLLIYLLTTAVAFAPWLTKNLLMTGNPVFPLANGMFQGRPAGWGDKEDGRWERAHSLAESDRAMGARFRALWRHIPADAEQRLGPAIILLALVGLIGRRLERSDVLLVIVLVIQVLIWLFATHLYARFTVPFLIPLSLLAGRALVNGMERRRAWIVGGVLLAGAAWNFAFASQLHDREVPGGAPASLIYDGTIPGLEYFAVINHELPTNAKVLMIGDARAFYFQRPVDYCVVFNRSPFVEVLETTNNMGDAIHWLRDRGYTHVLVHWQEISRLRRTYGFSAQVTPELFDRLATAGLKRTREFHNPDVDGRWVELYEVP